MSGSTTPVTVSIGNSVDAVLNAPADLFSGNTIEVLASGQLTIDDMLTGKSGSNIDNFGGIAVMGGAVTTESTSLHIDRAGSSTTIHPGASYTWSPGSSYQLDGTLNILGTSDFQGEISGNGSVNGNFTAKSVSSTSPRDSQYPPKFGIGILKSVIWALSVLKRIAYGLKNPV